MENKLLLSVRSSIVWHEHWHHPVFIPLNSACLRIFESWVRLQNNLTQQEAFSNMMWLRVRQLSISTHLQASWPGWDSRRGRPLDSLASYRTQSVLHHHSWNTHLLFPWSLLAWSSSSLGPFSFLPSVSVSLLAAGSEQKEGKKHFQTSTIKMSVKARPCGQVIGEFTKQQNYLN